MFFDTGAYFEALHIATFYPHVEVSTLFIFDILNFITLPVIDLGCFQYYQ